MSTMFAFYFAGGNKHLVEHADDTFVCFGTDAVGDKQGGHGVVGCIIESVGSGGPHLQLDYLIGIEHGVGCFFEAVKNHLASFFVVQAHRAIASCITFL